MCALYCKVKHVHSIYKYNVVETKNEEIFPTNA